MQVPEHVTELRLAYLEGLNLNCLGEALVASTALVGTITITKARLHHLGPVG
jgi:hypothetical protein